MNLKASVISSVEDLAFAERLADAARPIALEYFRAGIAAEAKPGEGFDPVTVADRGIEARIRALITQNHPLDGVLGEEEAHTASQNGRTWVIDPIDGTRAFIAGLPTWMVMIALSDAQGPRLSVLDQPFTGERYTGLANEAAWLERGSDKRRIRVRQGVRVIEDAILSTTDPGLFFGREADAFNQIAARAKVRRFGLDAYGYAALAVGGIDLVIESGLKSWDVAALAPVVTGAGGIITDWQGGPCHEGGQVIAASSQALHAAALECLSEAVA